jgi:hypothetical protein
MGEQDNLLPEDRLQISALIAGAYSFNSPAPESGGCGWVYQLWRKQ